VPRPSRAPLRVVVTAGPTREPLDDVRYLSNESTGRMGIELAREARRRGARVTLLLGPTPLAPPPGVALVRVGTTRELLAAARRAAKAADVVYFAAAPADWRPAKRARGKLKKDGSGRDVLLRLVENPDVAATLGRAKGRRVHVGFALEVQRALPNARRKLLAKNFDAIVLNGPANVGGGGGRAWLLTRDAAPVALPTGDKRATARAILDRTLPGPRSEPRRRAHAVRPYPSKEAPGTAR
jgi:phosphopantothenoylcysteine decarboxylase / phosphopantothenate---cysteine ligase